MEIIEIGAVRLINGEIVDVFHRMVRPVVHPELSEFCRKLTTIEQREVDEAEVFPMVYPAFVQWLRSIEGSFIFCSWGRYDLNQLELDVRRHNLPWMAELNNHLNLKHLFAEHRRVKPCGMERALQLVNLPLEGTHHRGLDDARNIARLTQWMLPWLLQSQPVLTSE